MGLIETPTMLAASSNPPKRIADYVGRFEHGKRRAQHRADGEPRRLARAWANPEFDEYTLVLGGTVRVETRTGSINVTAGQAFLAPAGGSPSGQCYFGELM